MKNILFRGKLFRKKEKKEREKSVVYFDQRAHACACVGMVENDKNIRKL